MAVFRNQTFTGQRVLLDNHTYDGCTLVNCAIVYRGGEFKLNNTTIDGASSWSFEGPALLTVQLLQALQLLPADPSQLKIVPTRPV